MKRILIPLLLLVMTEFLVAGVTGKIRGRVVDAQTGEPLPWVNVMLEGTSLGAATDANGVYVILNVPPGEYTLVASMMGYKKIRIENLRVKTDFTTVQNFRLEKTVLEFGEEVVVIGRKPEIQKDRTSTMVVVSADELRKLPVKELSEVVNLQAGVVNGHFRGGRTGEVAYLVNGISVNDPYNKEMALEIEKNAIQEIKVISGTFSAEYGQALSGVVNIVTKRGLENFRVHADLYSGDYVSNQDPPFTNIKNLSPFQIRNVELDVTGPIAFLKNSSFFVSARNYFNEGYLYGVEEFLPGDSSNFDDPNPDNWYIERSGSGKYIPMNYSWRNSFQGSFYFKITPRLSLDIDGNYGERRWKEYNHLFKYNPRGIPTKYQSNYQIGFTLTHSPSAKMFYTLRGTNYYTRYKSYVYSDPNSDKYVSPQLLRRLGYGFYTGGMDMSHFYRSSKISAFKFNLVSQPNTRNEVKCGFEMRRSNLWLEEFSLRLDRTTGWKPEKYPPESVYNNKYRHIPLEFGAWIEDKIELERLILSVGVRFDYFEPDGLVPKDLRDPDGSYKGEENPFRKASPKKQLSPRLGISYPITDKGAIHISYGHFFQIPRFEYLYYNSEFEVQGGGLNTIMGNADLKPEKTVIYQLGLQQMIGNGLILDVTGYYKDIRNLVGTQIYELYVLGDMYARYENRDYGNVRGIAVTLTQKAIGWFSGSIDYTYQIAEGNASDPRATFYDRQSDPPRESEIQVVPLDWDQTHTLNVSVVFTQPSWIIGLVGKYGSGLPYTPEYQNQRTAFENSERKPSTFSVDLNAAYRIKLGKIEFQLYSQVKNLFDRANALQVFPDTGRPDYSLIPTYVPEQPIHSLRDFLTRPDYYYPPREVIIGLEVML